MKKLKLYKRNKSQKSKLSEIFDVVKNADRRACSLLTLLNLGGSKISSYNINNLIKSTKSLERIHFKKYFFFFYSLRFSRTMPT